MSCKCQECGKKYKLDIILPDKVWIKISPKGNEGGLLCPSCIVNKLEQMLSYNKLLLVGDYGKRMG